MPNQPRDDNPPRSFRIPGDLYRQVKARAAERGETVTDVIIRAMKRYVRGTPDCCVIPSGTTP